MSQARGRKAHFSETKFNSPNDSFIFICFQLAACIPWFVQCISLTHWLLELFAQMLFLVILEIFRLDIGQSSFNLVKKASATWQHAFLPLASHFTIPYFGSGMCRNQNFEARKWPMSRLSFLYFLIFFHFSFCSFSFLFAIVIDLLMGSLAAS